MPESNLINRGTLLGFLLGVMLGTGATMGTLAILRARSQEAANREQPRVEPPANTDADKRALEKRERAEKIRKLEQYAESLRSEIAAMEKQIELLGRGNPEPANAEENAKRLAKLKQRITDSDADLSAARNEVIKLEAERKLIQLEIDGKPGPIDPATLAKQVEKDPRVLNVQAAVEAKQADLVKLKKDGAKDGDPRLVRLNIEVEKLKATLDETKKTAEADATKVLQAAELASRKMRASKLDAVIAIKKEARDKLKEERDNLEKLTNPVTEGVNLQAMRDALKPQRDMLEKANAELAKLRIEAKMNE